MSKLSKKYVVQKSFRIESGLESRLEFLAKKLNRPQNDLVNAALDELVSEHSDLLKDEFFDITLNSHEMQLLLVSVELHEISLERELSEPDPLSDPDCIKSNLKNVQFLRSKLRGIYYDTEDYPF